MEKNRFTLSFLLAGALHMLVIFGGHSGFISPPEYGIQGSSASMQIYMVAALPERARDAVVKSKAAEAPADLAVADSEMEIAQAKKQKADAGKAREEDDKLASAKAK